MPDDSPCSYLCPYHSGRMHPQSSPDAILLHERAKRTDTAAEPTWYRHLTDDQCRTEMQKPTMPPSADLQYWTQSNRIRQPISLRRKSLALPTHLVRAQILRSYLEQGRASVCPLPNKAIACHLSSIVASRGFSRIDQISAFWRRFDRHIRDRHDCKRHDLHVGSLHNPCNPRQGLIYSFPRLHYCPPSQSFKTTSASTESTFSANSESWTLMSGHGAAPPRRVSDGRRRCEATSLGRFTPPEKTLAHLATPSERSLNHSLAQCPGGRRLKANTAFELARDAHDKRDQATKLLAS